MKIAVVTTFHEAGLNQYGQRMIDTFCKNWPEDIRLYVYPEKCQPRISNPNQIISKDLDTVPELTAFKNRWRGIPKANGDVSDDPVRSRRKDAGKGFKWDAVRFAHKVYSIFDCAKNIDADVLLWMDADTVCHSPINMKDVLGMIPADRDLCFLGRKGKYSECGLYAMNLKSQTVRQFLAEFQRVYDDAEKGIFLMAEWHDSFVFDEVRKRFPELKQLDWANDLSDLRASSKNSPGEGHPLINSKWGAWLDHLKGDRKDLGRSKREDLKIDRKEDYWRQGK